MQQGDSPLHSGWLNVALKGHNQKHAVFQLPSSGTMPEVMVF
jgi:hypothetical protein